MFDDTIAAIATPLGEGGIGIIRISGDKTLDILNEVFVSFEKIKKMEAKVKFENRKLLYGHIIDKKNEEKIDEVLVTFMKAENSYTREDVGEIYCHGSMIALKKTLDLVLKSGARIADRGEFTKRGFLNGRIDLAQAEAVIDMIKAKTEKGYSIALSQLEGGLSTQISAIRDEILKLLAHIIVNIDYPDADIEDISYKNMSDSLLTIRTSINDLLETSETGKIIREGLSTAIIGKPNVGKSSLLNALLKENRAIVTEIPGTTRDTIEEIISVHQIPIKLIDTAGIRETNDEIEKIGIKKSKESFEKADLIILMLNAATEIAAEDLYIIKQIRHKKIIVLKNKIDLGKELSNEEILKLLPDAQIIETSLKSGIGIKQLETAIVDYVFSGKVKQEDSMIITNARHKQLLEYALASITEAIEMTSSRQALDFIEVDIKRAWEQLGEIIGETISENIIDEVFSRFCLGK